MSNTTMNIPISERIRWLCEWEADVEVRTTFLPHTNSWEILFKHRGTTQWHEFIISDIDMRSQELRQAFLPLKTLLKVTAP